MIKIKTNTRIVKAMGRIIFPFQWTFWYTIRKNIPIMISIIIYNQSVTLCPILKFYNSIITRPSSIFRHFCRHTALPADREKTASGPSPAGRDGGSACGADTRHSRACRPSAARSVATGSKTRSFRGYQLRRNFARRRRRDSN